MRVINTARLTLEPQTAAHANEMFVVLSDPAIYEYENKPPPSLEWLRVRFARLETRLSADGHEQWLNWVIRLATSELVWCPPCGAARRFPQRGRALWGGPAALIGYVQATVRPAGDAAIAYELSSPYWGRGLAFEAVNATIVELVEHYGVRSLFAVLKHGNFRSVRLLERLGFCPASAEERAQNQVEPDEALMRREGERK